jgi:hypothetical protein
VGRQYLGSIGKIDNGVVSVSSLWANERMYYHIEVEPYTPAAWFAKGKSDPAFRTKPQIALGLVRGAHKLGIPFGAVVADSFYGEHLGFREELQELGVGYVLALKPSHCWWHLEGDIGCVGEVAQAHHWEEKAPGSWVKLIRSFRDGHRQVWWALEAQAGPYGVNRSQRLIIATTDPLSLPEPNTWYLVTNLPAPSAKSSQGAMRAQASLAQVIRHYSLRVWVEQSYKQLKGALGWAQYQVRSSKAIQRHWQLVFCAFSFCWWAAGQAQGVDVGVEAGPPLGVAETDRGLAQIGVVGGKGRQAPELADGIAVGAGLAGAVLYAETLLAGMVGAAPTGTPAGTA